MHKFQELTDAAWKTVFFDPCTADWKAKWSLDGQKATVSTAEEGMDFAAGSTPGDDACHAVLWTQQRFAGDLKIEYTYTRTDAAIRFVTILYVQASGSGEGVYTKDIAKWAHLRTVPAMSTYYDNMDTLHISYAAFGVTNENPELDYIRARRYMPLLKQGLAGTALQGEYLETGLFATGVPHRITVLKAGDALFMHIGNSDGELLCQWHNTSLPPILEGRIGLRHMYTRAARYRDFRVSVPQTETQ